MIRLAVGVLTLSMLVSAVPPLRGIAGWVRDAFFAAAAASRLVEVRTTRIVDYASEYAISFELAAAIERAAYDEGIDPDLGFRLISVESRFREDAVSEAGALGLTQLMPATADWLQPGITHEQIFQRDTNLRLGFRYLRSLLRVYDGDVTEALHAYNRGPGTVARIRAAGGDPANGYARRVLGSGAETPYDGNGLLPTPEANAEF
jgi:soluble lytic murein transglycosylase-like protein